MRRFFFAFVLFFGWTVFAEQQTAKEIQIGMSDIFVNPSVRAKAPELSFVVSGVFPNACYRWSKAEVNHLDNNVHEVTSYAFVQPGLCVMAMVPYTRAVKIGPLEPGNHRVRLMNADGTYIEKTFTAEGGT